jgi:hypothetical protein
MPGCESILAVSASWLICVCGFCLCGIRSWNSHLWWVLEMTELLDLLQRCWVEKAGPNPWPGSSCEFTLLDNVLWDYVTEHIYIRPFGILLMEGHIEIEHVLRPGLLLGLYAAKSGTSILIFWYSRSVPSLRLKMSKKYVLIANSMHILDVCQMIWLFLSL